MKLRMMTYNIQHGLDYNCRLPGRHPGLGHDIDLTQIAAVIRMQGPDIVALNEVRGLGPAWEYTAQAETIAGMLGWHCYFAPAIWFDGTSPYGNAILSRYPLLSAERILIPDPEVKDEDAYYETRCVLRARIAVAGGDHRPRFPLRPCTVRKAQRRGKDSGTSGRGNRPRDPHGRLQYGAERPHPRSSACENGRRSRQDFLQQLLLPRR